MTTLSRLRRPLLALTLASTAGCTWAGAPSYELFGAFFPAWMLCALAGILAAAAARVAFTTARLVGVVPYQLAVCGAIGVIVALLVWLVVFR